MEDRFECEESSPFLLFGETSFLNSLIEYGTEDVKVFFFPRRLGRYKT